MNENGIGGIIAAYRKEAGMTQEQLAGRLGITFQAVSKWENDIACPDIMLLPNIADIFGVPIDALFGRTFAEPTEAKGTTIEGLPWGDDNTLHAVLYLGHTLVRDSMIRQGLREKENIVFSYEGEALNVDSDFAVNITGAVAGDVTAGDGVNCGNVLGHVTASDSVTCAEVMGNVKAGDGVKCLSVGGSVTAGDSVYCGAVGGAVIAGDGVYRSRD